MVRTRQRLKELGLASLLDTPAIKLTDPLSYIEFMRLVVDCRFAPTDSGGVREEDELSRIPRSFR